MSKTLLLNFIFSSILVAIHGHKECEKEEFEVFYKEIAEILAKRSRYMWIAVQSFKEDQISVYGCGDEYLMKIQQYQCKNETALSEEERKTIRDQYSILVSSIVACQSFDLWAGEKQGGTIASAIYHAVEGDPVDIIGPKNETDRITEITYPS